MARVTFSALISDMRGKTGDVVFSIWKGIHYIRSRVTPSNPRTDAQTAQREALANTLTMWQSVKAWAKAVWDRYASGYSKSGYNRYIEDNLEHVRDLEPGILTPFDPEYTVIGSMAAAAGGVGEITCTWDKGTGLTAVDTIRAYFRKVETDSEQYAWTDAGEADVLLETLSIPDLDTGQEYEVAFFCHTADLEAVQQSYNALVVA